MRGKRQRDRNFINRLSNDDRPLLQKLSSGGVLDENKNHFLKLVCDFLLIIDSSTKRKKTNIISEPRKNYYKKDDTKTRYKSEIGIRRSMDELKSMISLNVHDKSKVIGFTLTYSNAYLSKYGRSPEDYKKVGDDFEYFIKKLRAKFVKEYGEIEYIYMKELQLKNNRNVYHIHGLLIANESTKPFIISKEDILAIWTNKKGSVVDVRNGEKIDVLHNYLTPHKNNSSNPWAKKMNMRAKNLEKIPYKARIYTTSNGIIQPVCILVTIEEALEIVNELTEFYPKWKINYFPSSFNDGYGCNEIERRMFDIPHDPQSRDMIIKKVVEFAKRKKKAKKLNL